MSWFKQKGKGAGSGVADHAQLTNLEYDESGHVDFQRQVSVWAAGQHYTVNDLVTNNGSLYRCINNHTAVSLTVDLANWECLSFFNNGGQGIVQRVSQLNVTAPKTVELPSKLGLVQARIFVPGQESTQIDYDFDNADAEKFIIDGQSGELSLYYIWDGTMRPKTVYQSVFPVHRVMETGTYDESDWIDHSVFKAVEKVEVI